MRLKNITIDGFRAFTSETTLSLDADAVVLRGANGQGKTSLLDAILWALTGRLARLGDDPGLCISRFAGSGVARVSIDLEGERAIRVTRTFDGDDMRLLVESNGETLRGATAESELHSTLWPDALFASEATDAFAEALRRSVYLEQDRVRAFLDADSEHTRFLAVSELFGAGRVTELQKQLENEKKRWNAASNRLRTELDAKRNQLEELQGESGRLQADTSSSSTEEFIAAVQAWWHGLGRRGIPVATEHENVDLGRASSLIDTALRQLDDQSLRIRRAVDDLASIRSELENAPPSESDDIQALTQAVAAFDSDIEETRNSLNVAIAQAEKYRQTQLELREAQSELALLAQMALRHLDEKCPVCQQSYDREATIAHLDELASSADSDAPPEENAYESVAALEERLAQLQTDAYRARSQLEEAERQRQLRRSWEEGLAERLERYDINDPPGTEAALGTVTELVARYRELLDRFGQMRDEGERHSLVGARLRESERRSELQEQVSDLSEECLTLEGQLVQRDEAADTAEVIIHALREATERAVEYQLRTIQPLLERIYGRIDPHVEFRAVQFLTRYARGRGRLQAQLSDIAGEYRSEMPETVLSSSQMNALAVAIFLTFNLGIESLPLRTAILDDPLQSLDDVNLLGLVDTLRRTRDRRQLIVSTHDHRFGELLELKLRPVGSQQRTLVIEFDGWDRYGPVISQREVPLDRNKLRVVA